MTRPTKQLNILFDQTDHCSYFEKLGFGKKMKFEKMPNTVIPLVILTWLRQLQEFCFKLPDISSQADWSNHGRYIAQPNSKSNIKKINHVHLSMAKTQGVTKMTSFDDIKPKKKNKGTEKVVRSLSEWADRILCRNNDYVSDIATHSIKEGEQTSIPKRYAMNEKENFKQDNHGETNQDDEIKDFTPASQRRKTQEQLLSVVGDYIMDHIKKLTKAKKQKIAAINSANRAVACLVQYVNTVEQNAFQSFTEMKEHMAEKAKTNQTTNATDSSDDEYKSESDDNSDD